MTRFFPFNQYGKFSVNDFINNGYQSFTSINNGEELNSENDVELTTTGYKTINFRMKLSTFKGMQNHKLSVDYYKDNWGQIKGGIYPEFGNVGIFWSLEYLTASTFAFDYRKKMSISKVFNDRTVLVEVPILVLQSVTLSSTSGIVSGLADNGSYSGPYSFGSLETIGIDKNNSYGGYWLLGCRNGMFSTISTNGIADVYVPLPTTQIVNSNYLIRFTGVTGKAYDNYKSEWR